MTARARGQTMDAGQGPWPCPALLLFVREAFFLNVFDLIGPVMIGPSSSHTAGTLRIARVAFLLLGEAVERADVTLFGSLGATYRGHGSDRAIAAGLLGFLADDERVPQSLNLAKERGLEVGFTASQEPARHANSMKIEASGGGKTLSLLGASVGGGSILIYELDGMEVHFTGEMSTLLAAHDDARGVIASITGLLAGHSINIATMRVFRSSKGGRAMTALEADQPFDPSVQQALLRLEHIHSVTLINAFERL